MNRLHGNIPEVVGELSLLHALNLSHNNLTGPIPTSFGNLIGLELLDFSFNKLSGRIPSQLTNLTFLEVVRFQNNNLVGPIPHDKQFSTFENDPYIGNLGLCGLPLSKECNNDERPEAVQNEEGNGNGIAFIWKVAMMGLLPNHAETKPFEWLPKHTETKPFEWKSGASKKCQDPIREDIATQKCQDPIQNVIASLLISQT
ncbi:receptor-like protein 9DC3 [Gossypium hirsutum]|uniref:Receptor-like protein 9DC3 n=1 Tax=Gossypium hirsutum TaxID=3635 RepID=A0ABM2YVW1_GOSHI|nr:receptor-like protein 9DC3 [Gossypium hirsutum]